MLDIFSQYATDETLENNGTWFDIGSGARLLIARSGNAKFAKGLTKSVERARKVLDMNDDAADAKSNEIMIEVMAKSILLGWEGLTFKGEALPYSVENAKKLLAIKDFRRQVSNFAEDVDAFKFKEEVEQGEA